MIGSAGGADGDRNVVEGGQQVFSLHSGKTHIEIPRHAVIDRAIDRDTVESRDDPVPQAIS